MSEKLYKGRYLIAFYDEKDEELLHLFDNVKDILAFQKKKITKDNLQKVYLNVYRGLKQENHLCEFLTGKSMHIYLIDNKEEEN